MKTHKTMGGMEILNKLAGKKKQAENFLESVGRNMRPKKGTTYGNRTTIKQGISDFKKIFAK